MVSVRDRKLSFVPVAGLGSTLVGQGSLKGKACDVGLVQSPLPPSSAFATLFPSLLSVRPISALAPSDSGPCLFLPVHLMPGLEQGPSLVTQALL